jgi:hypothetical protein
MRNIWPYIPWLIEEYIDTCPGRGQYIYWLRVIDEYSLIFLSTEEHNPLH